MQDTRTVILIFSFNRALQLDATLRSLLLHCSDVEEADIQVLYRTESALHTGQYRRLRDEFSRYGFIRFVPEKDFRSDVLALLALSENVLFLVDDNIFIENFSLQDTVETLDREQSALGFSLRLGRNTTYCYSLDAPQRLPDFTSAGNRALRFDWRTADYDFGYSLEVSSSLYRTDDLFPLLADLPFRNPNTLEEGMAARKALFAKEKPYLLCLECSVTFCAPINKVQSVIKENRSGNDISQSPDSLAALFEQGSRVRIEAYCGFRPNACHQEVELILSLPAPPADSTPLVSVVIPCYKQAHFLAEAVVSVAAQTYSNWECLIINDGSPDNTSDVARELIARYPGKNIRLLEKPNSGLPDARNLGIQSSNGVYWLPLDADDRIAPQFLEKTVPVMQQCPEIGFVYSHIQHFGDQSDLYLLPEFDADTVVYKDNICCVCSLVRKSTWSDVGGYNTEMKEGYEDWDFWISCIEKGWKGYRLPEALFYYRKRVDSMLNGSNQKREELMARIVLNHPQLYDELLREKAEQTVSRYDESVNATPPAVRGNILIACSHFWPSIGGLETIVEQMGVSLVTAGYDVSVMTGDFPGRTSDTYRGVKIISLDTRAVVDGVPEWLLRIRSEVTSGKYKACILIQDPIGQIIWSVENAVVPSGTRLIIQPIINADGFASWYNREDFSRRLGAILRSADSAVAMTRNGPDVAFMKAAGVTPRYIPNAVRMPESRGNFRERYGIGNDEFLILHVANLYWVKNHVGLMDSLASIPKQWRLVMIGHPSGEPDCAKQFLQVLPKYPHITYISGLPKEETSSAIAAADVVVLASHGEGSPVSILEAMAHGKPWIATPTCGAVHDNAGGIICPLTEFRTHLAVLCDFPEIREALGKLGQLHWQSCFSWPNVIKGWIDLIEAGRLTQTFEMSAQIAGMKRQLNNIILSKINKRTEENPPLYFNQSDSSVNIGMVTYNRLEFTRQAIDALVRTADYPFTLTVIDNNSKDGTKEYLKDLKEKGIIRNLVLLDENVGVAKASNLAWSLEPDTPYYLKLDNDIVMQKKGWLGEMIAVIEAFPQIGALAYNFEPVSYPAQTIGGFTVRVKEHGNLGGACILIPKRTEKLLGVWCEDYGLYGEEDHDYGQRTTIAGFLNVYMAEENAGFHLPAGKAAVIDQTTFKAVDGIEEKEHKGYREMKDNLRKKALESGLFERNIAFYNSDPGKLFITSRFVTEWRVRHQYRETNISGVHFALVGRKPGKIKVAVYSLDSREHACGHYRINAPLTALADAVEIMWGIQISGNSYTINTDGIESADLIVVQRFLPRPDTKAFLDYLCSLGKPVIFEIDDLLTQLPASNPNHEWGMLGAPHIHDFMRRCAAVTVSTDELKERFSPYNDTIHVLPNLLDSGLWEKPSPPSSGPVVIGYAGTNTHGADLELLEKVLARIARRYGNKVSFTFMGCATERISRLPGFRFVPFETTYEAYAQKFMDIPVDIMLAPLEDNPFNRCKSNVKWLEYSACGMAGIYSDLPPYSCVKSGETGLLVRNIADDWYNAIACLIDDPEKRRQIARNAREEIMTHYTVAAQANLYLDTYSRIAAEHSQRTREIHFSIIIMTWNRSKMLDLCLASLFASISDRDTCQIIVGNNGSSDNTEEVLSRYRIDRYVKKIEKSGLEFYRELFALAEGEYIIELDDDVLDLPKNFDQLFGEYFRSFPDYGFLGLDVVQNRFTNGAKPEPSRYREDVRTGMTIQEGEVIGCCACIKNETFDRIGGFNDVILSMAKVEDGVLTERVRKLGLRTGIIKDVKCFHANGPYYSKAYGYIDRDMEKYAMAGLHSFAESYRNVKEGNLSVPIVSIIIPLFNKVEYTRQCLEGMARLTTSLIDYELVLVDNASTDGTSELLRTLSGDVTIITNLTNLGFARACNQGARLATSDYLVFLNNDTIPKTGWLEALVDGIERDRADICGARLLYPNGKVQHAGVAFNEQGIGYHIFNGFDVNAAAVTRKRFMQCVTAACMIMRKELFHTLSGFDEGYVNGYEDVDLCLRAGELGKRILYVPDCTLIHFEETSEGRKSHEEPNARRYSARWKGKVRCDDNDYYRLEGFRKELMPDGRIHVFKMNAEQPAPQQKIVPETGPLGQNRITPPSCRILTDKGISLKREGRYAEALEVFSSARNQGDTSVLAHMGDCLANLGKVAEAEAAYMDALKIRDDDALAHTGIGVIQLLAQQYSSAAIAFGKALHSDRASSKALCGLGMCRYGQGHKKASYEYFSKALDADPENVTALHELIRTVYELGEFEHTIIHTRNYLMYHPVDFDILFSFAGILYKNGAYEEAGDVMERLMALSPEFRGGKELLESICTASVNNAPLKTADEVDKSSRDSCVSFIEQGRIYKAADKHSEAFECFSKARELGDLSVLSEMGDCKAKTGDMKGAIGCYEDGLLNNPDDVRSLVGLGVVLLLEENLPDAGICFAKALKAENKNPKALCGLAMLRNREGKLRDAHDLFTQALDSDPENLTTLGELIKCSYRLERFTEAERYLENYLRYHPADFDMLFSQAGIQFRIGKSAEAMDNIEKLLIFAPEYDGGQELKEKIGAMPGLNQAPAYQYQIAG
jgi:GT2 family glycosyltransferase/tetratricopeptide (TPR) repeat protein/glycosyltransferase involved in cell wall biosynthesis